MNSFKVNQTQLNAMLVLAGKKDIRYYLNGLHIEWDKNITRIVATDGHKMAIYQVAGDNVGAGSITIPRDTIENLPKNAGSLEFSQVSETHWQVNTGLSITKFAPCDSKFPDFRRVVHSLQTAGTSGVAAGFNLTYLNEFEKAGNLLAGSKLKMGNRLRLHHNGDSGALVLLNCVDNFAGVIMPLRDSVGSTGALFPADLSTPLTSETSPAEVAAALETAAA